MTDALARLKFKAAVEEIKSGKRGWISITHFVREHGSNKEQLTHIALVNGLRTKNHGRHGLTASK